VRTNLILFLLWNVAVEGAEKCSAGMRGQTIRNRIFCGPESTSFFSELSALRLAVFGTTNGHLCTRWYSE
jgi:hypothetical protein